MPSTSGSLNGIYSDQVRTRTTNRGRGSTIPISLGRIDANDAAQVAKNFATLALAANPPVPQARVFNSANLTLTTSTLTVITFNSERFDSGSLHSTASNTGRLTAPITGLYYVGGQATFASNATGYRLVTLRLNGATRIRSNSQPAVSGDTTAVGVDTLYQLTAGDYVEMQAFQTSGGNLDVAAELNSSPEFWMVRLGGFVNQGV